MGSQPKGSLLQLLHHHMGGDKAMSYNGWTNYETWNVALWLDNDYESYQLARTCKNFREYRKAKNLRGEPLTGDHISLFDDKLNIKELDEKIKELGE